MLRLAEQAIQGWIRTHSRRCELCDHDKCEAADAAREGLRKVQQAIEAEDSL